MSLSKLLITLIGTTLRLHAVVAFKKCYYMSVSANLPALVRSCFNRGSGIVISSSVHDTDRAHKGAKSLRLLPLSAGNKSSLRVAEKVDSVSRGSVRSTT